MSLNIPTADQNSAKCCDKEMTFGHVPMEVLYGVGPAQVTIIANVPAWTCGDCGDVITADGAEQAEHDAVAEHLGRLTSDQISAARYKMGLSQSAFALRLRVSRVTVNRWESGIQLQSVGHDAAIVEMLAHHQKSNARNRQYVFRTDVSHREDAAHLFVLRAA